WAFEQFQLLTEIALHTKRLKLATGIANVFSRSAGLLAMSVATLDEISEGRAILGLGTSGKLVIENFHGVPYRKPLTRLKERGGGGARGGGAAGAGTRGGARCGPPATSSSR